MSSALEYLTRQLGVGPRASYVVGLATSPGIETVALVRKARPARQEGRLNGVGGKIEPGEAPRAAMIREWAEQTTLATGRWSEFCVLSGGEGNDRWRVHFFHSTLEMQGAVQFRDYKTEDSDEPVEIYPVQRLNTTATSRMRTIPNIPWLLQMAKAHRFHAQPLIRAEEETLG